MIQFTAVLKKFADQGEKTGWTYLEISAELAGKLKPGNKKSFRVKGKIDKYAFDDLSLLPMGEGDFILSINATMRKAIRKTHGATVKVQLSVDTEDQKISADLLECLADEPKALKTFKSLTGSHQRYFSKWIESSKTDTTKAKRITQAIKALALGLGYPEMIRMNKKE